ncbi:hypothetical protein V499_02951 [Pseudogymnoascus sp. VKM F-103]|nr:hypothetical protein V499_02951 [Pseudogymnoascus sp. VKM F-103]
MATVHTADADFALTQATVQLSMTNGSWVRPTIDESVGSDLGAAQERPAYIPFQLYIDQNEADPNATQENRLEQESEAATRITHLARQITRGVEFLYHDLNGDNLQLCLPKHIKEFTQH